MNIIEFEKFKVIVQFGGQTPLKIAEQLTNEGAVYSIAFNGIDLAENREDDLKLVKKLKIQILLLILKS